MIKSKINQKIMSFTIAPLIRMRKTFVMPSTDAIRLDEILQGIGKVPADFIEDDSRADYLFLMKLLKKETEFSRTNLKRLSDLLGIDAFTRFDYSNNKIKGNNNQMATGGSQIAASPEFDKIKTELREAREMLSEMDRLRRENQELKQKYIALLEKLALK